MSSNEIPIVSATRCLNHEELAALGKAIEAHHFLLVGARAYVWRVIAWPSSRDHDWLTDVNNLRALQTAIEASTTFMFEI